MKELTLLMHQLNSPPQEITRLIESEDIEIIRVTSISTPNYNIFQASEN